MNRLMLDFETLDVAECPVILSMGVVVFNENGIIDCLVEKIDQHSCLDLGCTVSVDTLLWWEEQSDAAKKAAFGGTTNIGYAMGMLVDFYKKHECQEIWSAGALADIRWTNNILIKLKMEKPWKFYQEMCFRTFRVHMPSIDFIKTGTEHNALDDAINQARYWIEITQQNYANNQILNRFSPNPRHFTCQAIDTLDEVVENLLKKEEITFDAFKKSVIENGFQIELVTGNHIHGTYAIYLNPHAHIVNITKCECGKIHYLEDECIECNFDLEDNFLGNGTPIAIIQNKENQTTLPMKTLSISWLGPCENCGHPDLDVDTKLGFGKNLYDGDKVKCPNCDHEGEIINGHDTSIIWFDEMPF